MIKVVQFSRRSRTGHFSVERINDDIRSNLPEEISVETRINKYFSDGVFKRIADSLYALLCQKDVNHITGDVHYLSFFLRRERTVLTILDCVGLERSTGIKFWLLWILWYWLPEKRCSIIIVISEATKNQIVRYLRCDPEKLRVIHVCVSDEFRYTPKVFDTHSPRILHIGTDENKNLKRHISALTGIACNLVVIGELSKDELAALKRSGIKYENLVDLSSESLLNEYVRSDLLLFASLYEGFGMPIVEAQAVGRPVVTSTLWSMPEVAGDAAVLVDPYDIDSIRSGVMRVIDCADYREGLIHAGRENSKRFSAKAMGLKYAKVYREIYQNTYKLKPEKI